MRTLHTRRLRLTPVTAQNAAALWTILQQPDLRTFQDLPNVGVQVFSAMVAKRPKRLRAGVSGRFEWLVHFARGRKPVGWVSLRITEKELHSGELGYSVLREFRRRGIGSEAVRVIIGEAFKCGLMRVRAYCVPENEPSRRLLERIGFEAEGVLPRGATVSGRPVDVLVHRMERDRWRQSGKTIDIPASA